MVKIKPCVFCRDKAVFEHYYPYDGYQGESCNYQIRCVKCGLRVSTTDKEKVDEMIYRWNFCSDLTNITL